MIDDRIVLIAPAIDKGDILCDFLNWHLDLGVHQIVVHDLGSTDGSRDLLDDFARSKPVTWSAMGERDMTTFDLSGTMARNARDPHQADWIILCDVGEFLCPLDAELGTILSDAAEAD